MMQRFWVDKVITKSFQVKLQTSTKIFESNEFVSDLVDFFVNRLIL